MEIANGALTRSEGAAQAAQLLAKSRLTVLSRVNRWLGHVNIFYSTVSLAGFAVISAVGLHWLLGTRHLGDLFRSAIVTVIVGAPIIFYAQTVIRQLAKSRRASKQMAEKLAWALANAEQANAAKSSFLANMSHELRTPLNAIIGFSDIIRFERFGPVGSQRYVEYGKDINESGIHLLSIINDILDLAKIEAGQAVLENEERIDIRATLEKVSRIIQPLADRRHIDISLDAGELHGELLVVQRMFHQIVLNILSNAVKFSPASSQVKLSYRLKSGEPLVISIHDNGPGMTPAETRLALTPFGQVPHGMTNHGGTGLGLPLANAMMELHGGELNIRSEPGKGTTIDLVFPAERVFCELDVWTYLFA
ncbi:MAG: hypothetical protein GC184_09100 [Rhizobiales bacterium]|nr:hypothetical protein [Hyphomicrobiales bacterium]